jgi:phosphoribosylaminoimidazolecarboxamide formyltransferase/IMP cyclohydrolase
LVKRALISVYNKEKIVEFANGLLKFDVEIISTGGTYKLLKENNIPVRSIEEITSFPEILNGRVKTLHPLIFGGILMNKANSDHLNDASANAISPIDLVVVNLYPFEDTIAKEGVTEEEAIEQIDIGGVTLIRAAAKNFSNVNVLVSSSQYGPYLDELKNTNNNIPADYSRRLAYAAFGEITNYDAAIQNYFAGINGIDDFSSECENTGAKWIKLSGKRPLRYGENPHQKAVLFRERFDSIFEILHGKEVSYNNILDIDAAYNLICEFENAEPACAIIKHGNPSGVASAETLQKAYLSAFATDTKSPFGGIIIFNGRIDFKTSQEVDKLFTEIILATDFDDDALELLKKKKNRRLIKFSFAKENNELRKVTGGYLYQEKDNRAVTQQDLKVVTERKPSQEEIDDMLFAFKIVKHTKSNAVVFIKDKKTLAIGGGQPSRIDSTNIAVAKAREFGRDLQGSVAASDAFFPFPDGLIEIAKAGASAVVQPGGSVKDDEVIKAADEHKLAMAFTGIRHFKH